MTAFPRIVPVELPTPSRAVVARRLGRAISAFTRHAGPAVPQAVRRRSIDAARLAHALRLTIDDLGATALKLGQLFGSSPDLFGDEMAMEFRACLDAAPPVPFPEVRAAIEADLGRPLESLYSSFEPMPVAAASLAVVHRATLPDGSAVAVKVLRPGIEDVIASDLAVLRPLFRWLGLQVAVGVFGALPGLIDGLAEQVAEEVDLRNEARAMVWFRSILERLDLHGVLVPEPFESCSGRRVLTMELVDGVPIDDLVAVQAAGIDASAVIQAGLKAWFATTICLGAFHGDIHAGNLLLTPDGRVGMLDWGIVGRLDPATHTFFRRLIEGTLGDETAWNDVRDHLKGVYGTILQDQLGLSDADMVAFIRAQIEPIFSRPFSEVDLRTMLIGPPQRPGENPPPTAAARTLRTRYDAWQAERRRVRSVMASSGFGTSFDRGTFLLMKQLVYLERYGKLYLTDVPLLWDREVFGSLLALGGDPVASVA